MSIDGQLPLRRNLWERLATSPGLFPGIAIFVGLLLNDVLGFWGSVIAAVVVAVLAVLLLRPHVRKSRRRRLDGNIKKGVVEAFLRFTNDDDGRTANHGWKEGALLFTSTGLAFQQLRGPGGRAVGTQTWIGRLKPLGRRRFNPGQAPGLDPDFAAFGFLVEQRELEVVLDPGYLKDPHIQFLLTGDSPTF